MAIRKEEVGALSPEEVELLNRLENELIDPRLNAKFDGDSGTPYVVFTHDEIEIILGLRLDHRLVAALRKRYFDWIIEDRSNREGTYLQFY